MLAGLQFFQRKRTSLFHGSHGLALLLFIICIYIYRHKTVKGQPGRSCTEQLVSSPDFYHGRLIHGRSHAAGSKTLPDQLIQTEKVSWKRFLYHYRSKGYIGRADSLMSILDLSRILFGRFACSHIVFSIVLFYKGSCRSICFFRDTGRIGSQISDQTDGAVPLYLYALIELLSQAHGLLGRKIKSL